MIHFFYEILYVPIYNLLIFFTGILPGGDVGLAVVIVTLLVKIVTSPLSISALKTQRRMKVIESQLKHVREKYKDDKEAQARETMALYKNNGIKPFSSIFGTLIQLPIIISLYQIFRKEQLLHTDISLLYSYIKIPDFISPNFLGIFSVTSHSIPLAALAGITQFFQARLSIQIPKQEPGTDGGAGAEFSRALAVQARYILPVFIVVIAYTSGAIALYFITSSIFGIAQELYVRSLKHPMQQPTQAGSVAK
jgi:YidC/Oxa1 family membrane protein insertase